MRWPRYLPRRQPRASEEVEHVADTAERALRDAQNMHARAAQMAKRLRATNERNNFGDAVAESFGGTRK